MERDQICDPAFPRSPAAEETLPAGLVGGGGAHICEYLAVIQQEEQGKEGDVHKELAQPGQGKGLEEGPDEPEVQQEELLAQDHQNIHQEQHTQRQQSTFAAKLSSSKLITPISLFINSTATSKETL